MMVKSVELNAQVGGPQPVAMGAGDAWESVATAMFAWLRGVEQQAGEPEQVS